jgi:DNA-binding NarL/FixJ family response regulator
MPRRNERSGTPARAGSGPLTKVIIASEDTALRTVLRSLVEQVADTVVVHEVSSAADAVTFALGMDAGLVVLDDRIDSGTTSGPAAEVLRTRSPGIKVILCTSPDAGRRRPSGVDATVRRSQLLDLPSTIAELLAAEG